MRNKRISKYIDLVESETERHRGYIGSLAALRQMRRAVHHNYDNAFYTKVYEKVFCNGFSSEAMLENELVCEFNNLFHGQLSLMDNQVKTKNKTIDMIAQNEASYFIIEVKIDKLIKEDVFQLHDYMQIYSDLYSPLDKKLYGILICPEIWSGGVFLKHFPNIFAMLYSCKKHEDGVELVLE